MNEKTTAEKTKLLVLTSTFPRWADDVEPPFVFELCRRLTEFEVHVIAPHAPGALDAEIMDGVHVHRFRYAPQRLETLAFDGGITANLKRSPWKYLLLQGFLLGMFFRALQVGRQHNIHLIHAHWLIPNGLVAAALKTLLPGDNKLLLTAHGGDVNGLRGKLFRALRRWVIGEADAVSAVSQPLLDCLQEELEQQAPLKLLAMGVDVAGSPNRQASAEAGQTLVYAGRLGPTKGLPHLLEAMRILVDDFPRVHLLIAGHGVMEAFLRARCKSLGLDRHVTFLGRYTLHELPDILLRANIAVLPFADTEDGNSEGLGLATIEAMACGLPVVAGDVAAIHSVIRHRETGLIVEASDHSALSQHIADLLENPEKANRLGTAGREFALAHFDWSISSSAYQALLKSL